MLLLGILGILWAGGDHVGSCTAELGGPEVRRGPTDAALVRYLLEDFCSRVAACRAREYLVPAGQRVAPRLRYLLRRDAYGTVLVLQIALAFLREVE